METHSKIRILVVEDELLIAMMLQDIIADLGFLAVGPAMRLKDALDLIEREPIDGALLDINLHGERVYPAADILVQRGLPIVLCTGYGSAGDIPDRYAAVPRVAKPFDADELRAIVVPLFAARPRPPADAA